MIEARQLSKTFRLKNGTPARPGLRDCREEEGKFHAIRDVSFHCAPGEVLGLLGPNGAGKTTALRILATSLRPDSGSAFIHGIDIAKSPLQARARIGFLSGSTGLYGRLTARENVEYFGRLHGLQGDRLQRRCDALFDQLDIHAFAHKRADTLSTGMKQRCSIARAVVHEPEVVIFDEPTTGLDVMSAKILLDFIDGYKALGIPLIFSTHHLHEIEKVCDRVSVINLGRTVFDGTTQTFRQLDANGSLYEAFVQIINQEP